MTLCRESYGRSEEGPGMVRDFPDAIRETKIRGITFGYLTGEQGGNAFLR